MFPPLSSHGGIWYGLRSSWQLADAYTVRVHRPSTASKMPKEIRCLRSSKIWWIQPQVGCECLQLAQISSQLRNWQKHYPHYSKHWIRAFGSELQGPGHAAASIVTSIILYCCCILCGWATPCQQSFNLQPHHVTQETHDTWFIDVFMYYSIISFLHMYIYIINHYIHWDNQTWAALWLDSTGVWRVPRPACTPVSHWRSYPNAYWRSNEQFHKREQTQLKSM
jgi:hypothetical protein